MRHFYVIIYFDDILIARDNRSTQTNNDKVLDRAKKYYIKITV